MDIRSKDRLLQSHHAESLTNCFGVAELRNSSHQDDVSMLRALVPVSQVVACLFGGNSVLLTT